MPNKLEYEEVKYFIEVESNSGCKLQTLFYINYTTYMDFECKCGKPFSTNFAMFKNDNKRQCNDCGIKKQTLKRTKTHEKFMQEFMALGIFDEYKVLGTYVNNYTKIEMYHVKCKQPYSAFPYHILAGHGGCSHCNRTVALTQKEFEQKVYDLVQDEYKVVSNYIHSKTYVTIWHVKCRHEFEVTPNNFLVNGQRCTYCRQISKGETRIRELLENKNIIYKHNKSFPNCKNKTLLAIDFYLPDYNVAIEFHGRQHYQIVERFGGEYGFQQTQLRDRIKEKYCVDKQIPLLIIPYWHYKNIKMILEIFLREINNKSLNVYLPFMVFLNEKKDLQSVNEVEYIIPNYVIKNIFENAYNQGFSNSLLAI